MPSLTPVLQGKGVCQTGCVGLAVTRRDVRIGAMRVSPCADVGLSGYLMEKPWPDLPGDLTRDDDSWYFY